MNTRHCQKWYQDKTVLVTGATSGIGKEMARLLSAWGAKVLFCGRDQEQISALTKELQGKSQTIGFSADFSRHQDLRNLVQNVRQHHCVDVLVNNAGFGFGGDFESMDQELSSAMLAVNIGAVVQLCHAFLPDLKGRQGTGILNVGSVASFFPTPGSAIYGATKHFIKAFTDALHKELEQKYTHVTGVYPGKTHTRFLERATAGKVRRWDKAMEPLEVAEQALAGLAQNKLRVIPGTENRIKLFLSKVLPLSVLLDQADKNRPQPNQTHRPE